MAYSTPDSADYRPVTSLQPRLSPLKIRIWQFQNTDSSLRLPGRGTLEKFAPGGLVKNADKKRTNEIHCCFIHLQPHPRLQREYQNTSIKTFKKRNEKITPLLAARTSHSLSQVCKSIFLLLQAVDFFDNVHEVWMLLQDFVQLALA
jgi:hypothetical protein